jgi:hypothetical protein
MTTNKQAIEAAIEAAERNASRKIRKATPEERTAKKAAQQSEGRDWDDYSTPAKSKRTATKTAAKAPASKGTAARKQPAKKTPQTPAKGKAPPKGKKPARKIAAKTPVPAVIEQKPVDPPEPVEIIMGRPVKYTPEITQALIDYFNIRVDRVENVQVPNKDGTIVEEKQVIVNDFPTLTRFAHEWGLTRQTLKNWADALLADGSRRYPDFFYAYTRAKEAQESLIVEGGMAGKYESRFVVFASKNLIGWRDQVEQTVTQTINTTNREALDAAYEAGMAKSQEARAQREAERRELSGDGS